MTEKLNKEKRQQRIERFTEQLPVLRALMNISQSEMSGILGISRQTYSGYETKSRPLPWDAYLALLLVFEQSPDAYSRILEQKLYPWDLSPSDRGQTFKKLKTLDFLIDRDGLSGHFDSKAIHTIETVAVVEYARCNDVSVEEVLERIKENIDKGQTWRKPATEN